MQGQEKFWDGSWEAAYPTKVALLFLRPEQIVNAGSRELTRGKSKFKATYFFKRALDFMDERKEEFKEVLHAVGTDFCGTKKRNKLLYFISRVCAAMMLCGYKSFNQIKGGGENIRQKCFDYFRTMENEMREYNERALREPASSDPKSTTNERCPLSPSIRAKSPYESVRANRMERMSHSAETEEPLFQEVNKILGDLKVWDKLDSKKQKGLDDAFAQVRIACDVIMDQKKSAPLPCPELYKVCSKFYQYLIPFSHVVWLTFPHLTQYYAHHIRSTLLCRQKQSKTKANCGMNAGVSFPRMFRFFSSDLNKSHWQELWSFLKRN